MAVFSIDLENSLEQQAEAQTMKMKGTKKGTVIESHAIQDTYLLKEKTPEAD